MRHVTIYSPKKSSLRKIATIGYYLDDDKLVAKSKMGETVKFTIDEEEHILCAILMKDDPP